MPAEIPHWKHDPSRLVSLDVAEGDPALAATQPELFLSLSRLEHRLIIEQCLDQRWYQGKSTSQHMAEVISRIGKYLQLPLESSQTLDSRQY